MTEVAEVPCPAVRRGEVLIRSTRSLVSVGTERMLVEFGKAGWLQKARQQPEKVQVVLDKVKTDGLAPTMEAVFNKLGQPVPLGYCNVGVVLELGPGASGVGVGERVVSNGKHAEVVSVPSNLCVGIPAKVTDDEASFTVVGAIGLQGIRLARPTLGEAVVVVGLGLIGLITVQLLRANGCRVLGVDYDEAKLELARKFGAEVVNLAAGEDPVASGQSFSRGRGVDAVIITAATKSSEPVHQAALMCRKRGRIILVGTAGLELSRTDFYEKELTFQVSCSYGPGRYDASYEERGVDYPVGFVRWTEQRNFEAVLDMMADGRLDVKPLVSHRFDIAEAEQAYGLVAGNGSVNPLGIVLRYPSPGGPDEEMLLRRSVAIRLNASLRSASKADRREPVVAFIGSGNYATAVLIPAFKEAGASLKSVVSSTGVSSVHAGRKFGFQEATTESETILADPEINAIVISTRHDSHASLALRAGQAGKHVFVEKPLALVHSDLDAIEAEFAAGAAGEAPRILMVGFNRRFAPHVRKIKSLLAGVAQPKVFVMTVNAGAIPLEHWTQNPEVGGGRIIGEGCHFVDLLRHLADAPITKHQAVSVAGNSASRPHDDKAIITLGFADGSIGTILYLANGHKSFPKERLEIFAAGRILQLDNFRRLTGYGWPGFTQQKLWRQDKGQKACAAAFVEAVRKGGESPIPVSELIEVGRVTINLAAALAADPSA